MPHGASVNDCLDIAVHVPIKDRVGLWRRGNDQFEEDADPTDTCTIDNTMLASPGAGRRAIVVVRPSYNDRAQWSNLDADNTPNSTDVYTCYPDEGPSEARPNIFLQWLQENEHRKWGVARTAFGEIDAYNGWYDDPRDSYKFTRFVPSVIPFIDIFTGSSGRRGPSEAVAKVPGANMRDVMVTDSDFYNSEVYDTLPSTLSNLPTVHKVPQGLAFFVDVTDMPQDGLQADPCKYVDHIMNQCLHRGSNGDLGCIAWLLDEMGMTPGYQPMANAKLLYSDLHWATQSTHSNKTVTPYERTTRLNLTSFPRPTVESDASNFPNLMTEDANEVADALGNGEAHRFTAGCRLAFGLEVLDHSALHNAATTTQREETVRETRAHLRARWEARNDVVDI
jgi:hypothetical protein